MDPHDLGPLSAAGRKAIELLSRLTLGEGPPSESQPPGRLWMDLDHGGLYASVAPSEWQVHDPEDETQPRVYFQGELVTFAGVIYRAKERNTNSQPDTHPALWEVTEDPAMWCLLPGVLYQP